MRYVSTEKLVTLFNHTLRPLCLLALSVHCWVLVRESFLQNPKPENPGKLSWNEPHIYNNNDIIILNTSSTGLIFSQNNWIIIIFNSKPTASEEFYDIHKVVLEYISENMTLRMDTCGYVTIITNYASTAVWVVAKLIYNPVLSQEDNNTDYQVLKTR